MDFQVGDVVNRTFGAISRNFVTFFLLSGLLVGVPALIIGYAQIGMITGGSGMLALLGVAFIVNLATTYLLQGALIHGAILDFNGQRASFGDCLSTGLKHTLPLIAIAILMGLGVMLGMLLLIIPGIILSIMWAVAIPARVVENTGITESLSRSSELTQNNRWKIFGLFIIYLVIATVITMIVMLPLGAFGANAPAESEPFGIAQASIAAVLFDVVATVLTAVVGAAGVSAIYFELRKAKEGVGAETLAKVFE
jgi:hypothetical protein